MKKLVLVLVLATLFSCEKETVKTTNGTCDCYVERQRLNIIPAKVGTNEEVRYIYSNIYKSDIVKDFCVNAYEWKNINTLDRERKVCK